MTKWWIVWQETFGDKIATDSFEQEPQNKETLASWRYGYDQVGYPVKADTEDEAIKLAFESEE